MHQRFAAILIFAGLVMVSCSAGGNNVTSPSMDNDLTNRQSVATYATHHLWGYWDVTIDPDNLTVEAKPLRGVQFTCNVTQFMQPPASPTHMLAFTILPGSDPSTGYFEVDVTLRHPFPGFNMYRGFDVKGVLIADGSAQADIDPSLTYGIEGDTLLLNADGHTRWWNPTEFTSYNTIFGYTPGKLAPPVYPTATLNPYKYFADDLLDDQGVWELDPANRGTFPTMPGVYTRPYHIQFEMDGPQVVFNFNYAIDASWSEPDESGEPDFPVDSFSLSANSVEPYCLSVVDTGSTAYYEGPGTSGGELNLAVRVFDWQAPVNPDGLPGELSALWLESPVLNAPVDILATADILPDGPTSSVFEVELGSLNLTQSGDEPLLVYAEVSEDFGYEPQVSGGDAFDYPDTPLGAYLLTTVTILSEGAQAPVVTAIDPDTGTSGTVLTDVQVSGQYFATGAQVELRNDDWGTIEADSEVTAGGGTIITCDIDLDAAAQGLWDVVVINPDTMEGVLEDGFMVDCGDEVHSYEGSHLINGGTWSYCQRGDLCILETGAYEGDCVVKSSYTYGTGDYPGTYVRFDPGSPSNATGTDYFSVPGRTDSQVMYVTMTAQIDQSPSNGHIGVVNGRMFDVVQIVDENGSHLEDISIHSTPDTYDDRYPVIPAIDFDADGDLWVIVDIRGEWHPAAAPSKLDPIWELRHFELQTSSPYYVENVSDRIDISDDLYDPNAEPYGHMWYIADMAISYAEDTMFVLSTSIQGWNECLFSKFDLSTTPPSHVENADLVDSMTTCSNPYSGVSRCDIDFDHSDLSAENCRLLVMYQAYSGSVDTHLMRLDTDFNILDDQITGPGSGGWDTAHAYAFNVDADNRNLIMIDMNSAGSYNDFYYFTMPSSAW